MNGQCLRWAPAVALLWTSQLLSGCTGANGTRAAEKAITTFSFTSLAVTGTIDSAARTISVTVPHGTDVTALVATFTTNATRVMVGSIVQVSGSTANDFTNPITYTAVAADGSSAAYTVTVALAPNTAKALTAFSFTSPPAMGTVDEGAHTVSVTVPYATNVTGLVAKFASTGVNVSVGTVSQVSGATQNDFTNPVIYMVAAGDGSTTAYAVTVTRAAPSSAKAITAYAFTSPISGGTIDATANTIIVTAPHGTDVTALVASFATTGVSVTVDGLLQVSGMTVNDFSAPVTYTVTAEDGTWADYNASVVLNASLVNAGVPRTGQMSCYDTVNILGAVVPCMGTAQDGDSRRGITWPEPRFTTNSDSTVIDNLTGLVWAPDASAPTIVGGTSTCTGNGRMTWTAALDYVACLNVNQYLGRTDWRLPNRKELRSLVNYGQLNNAAWLEGQGFTGVAAFIYWTSTTYPTNKFEGWYVDISAGGSVGVSWNLKSYTFDVWPVSGSPDGSQTCFSASTAQSGQTLAYYAGDDGSLREGVGWPAPRFAGNVDGTVTDGLTGLVWAPDGSAPTVIGAASTCAGGPAWWQGALDYVSCLNRNDFLGHSDWRLPNVNELESLFHAGFAQESCGGSSCVSNAAWLIAQGFANVQAANYWSSTVHAANSTNAWPVDMTDGTMFANTMLYTYYAWPVRGGN